MSVAPVDNMIFGFDPGTTNLGVAYIYPFNPKFAYLFQAKLERDKNPVQRIISVQNILSSICLGFEHKNVGIIEGASFGSTHRQVELAEIRASIALWCLRKGIEPKILPPKKIRKAVFGNGNTKASDEWENLPKDAADALACAYANLSLNPISK